SGRGWPIDEQWITGAAIGAAAAGSKAIARLPSMAQIYALEYVYNQAGKLRSMTGGQASMPFVLWVDGASRRRGSAGQHTDVGAEALYVNLPGVKVVVPSNAYDAKGLLTAAIRDPDPVAYFDYPEVRGGEQPDVPDEAYEVPFGEAVVRQEGGDLTLVAWAPATVDVGRALPEIASAGISVEFIDPRSLKPLDVETLARSARKTRRLLVVEHGHYTGGFSSHVIAEVAQEVSNVKVRKIAFPDVPGPGAGSMMTWLRPDAPKIVDAAKQLMRA
ncbi:MAG: transketolase C-terminal domain-containing protein, partial [Vicinamibacterales bacterium]|nr:transketolase C-terminal domain-containing protein [Vicinamibacterales bacterium]